MRYIILTAGRSGSTLLRTALQGHPDVLCFDELLEGPTLVQRKDKGVVIRERSSGESPGAYFEKVVHPAGNGFHAVGIKVKYYHFHGTRLADYLVRTGFRIIHSRRRNVVAQSLSLPLADEHEFSTSLDDPEHSGLYIRSVVVDSEDVISRAEGFAVDGERFMERFRGSLAVLDVEYEAVCRTDSNGLLVAQPEVDRILSFLDVPSLQLRTPLAKQMRLPYQTLIANWQELKAVALDAHPEWQSNFVELEAADGAGL